MRNSKKNGLRPLATTHRAINAKPAAGVRPVDVQAGLLLVHDRIVLAFRSVTVALAFFARSRIGLPRPLVVQRTTSVTPRAARVMKTIAAGFLEIRMLR